MTVVADSGTLIALAKIGGLGAEPLVGVGILDDDLGPAFDGQDEGEPVSLRRSRSSEVQSRKWVSESVSTRRCIAGLRAEDSTSG